MASNELRIRPGPPRAGPGARRAPAYGKAPPGPGAALTFIPVILFFILSTLSHGAAPGPPPPEPSTIGKFTSVEGVVRLRRSGSDEWAGVLPGAALSEGDRVRTGPASRASITLVDGTRLAVGDSTEVELTRFILAGSGRKAVYTVAEGKVRAAVGRFTGRTDVEVRTPTSVAGVKGTEFIVLNRGRANVYFGIEGTASVSGPNRSYGPVAELSRGTMTENAGEAGPITPVTVEPGSPLAAARASLAAVTADGTPVEWSESGRLLEILSRWNINYSAYLSDSGRFDAALDVLSVALELTASDAVRAEVRLARGSVFATGTGDTAGALAEYTSVLEEFPVEPFRERALFSAAVVYADTEQVEPALELFRRYLDEYPDGAHRATAGSFIRSLADMPEGGR